YSNPKSKRMFAAYDELKVLDMFTPAIGDSGSVYSGTIDAPKQIMRKGLQLFGDPEFAQNILEKQAFGEKSFENYFDLRYPPFQEKELRKIADKTTERYSGSRNLGGYGLAILEAGKKKNGVGAAIYYGPARAGHAHFDKPFMEVYGYGKKLIPDFGYPQFAAESKDPPAWERNTLSHYTVTVDASRQATQKKGILNQFAVTSEVRLCDVSAKDAYPHLDEYRRVTLLVGSESESPYFVDFFIVKGGKSHDYSIHGFTSEITTEGIKLSPAQVRGTLAGEDVPYGFLYDDPELEKPDKVRSYYSYTGSGYSYLYNVQRGTPLGAWSATWADKEIGIRAIFPSQSFCEVVVADGNPPKRPGSPDSLKYVLLRNWGDGYLKSRFICVLQPFKVEQNSPKALDVRRVKIETGDLLKISGQHGTDYIYLAENPEKEIKVGALTLKGSCVVIRMDAANKLKSVFISGGGVVRHGLLFVEAAASEKGQVKAMDFAKNEIVIESKMKAEELEGKTILFGRSNYRIEYARRKGSKLIVGFGEYSPRTGKIVVDSIDKDGGFLTTRNLLYFAASGCYKDAWLVAEDFSAWHRVADVEGGKIIIKDKADINSKFMDKDGDGRITAYFYDVVPGQEYEIPAVCVVERNPNDWSISSTSPARAELPDGTRVYR
ncbi:MAG: heparinase II/III family protein, partial [Armatimonadota bacterium]|nr:heparinase II/III family protein [Armatimonadota bacterium]